MQAKWQGIDLQAVYQDWAEALQGCSLGAIDSAIHLAKESEHPPNQGEFKELCRGYKPPPEDLPILTDKSYEPLTQDQIDANLAKIREMLGMTKMVVESKRD